MKVTTGRIIKVNVLNEYYLERSSETPGLVVVQASPHDPPFRLPGNKVDAEKFIMAYRRVIDEPLMNDIGYPKSEVE